MVMQCVTVNMLSTGSLYITSTPPGASIYIDGELQTGITTPATITTLVEGNHDITISMDGFNDYITTVNVVADTITTVPDIVLIPNEGCIYFATNPPGASIYIDDELQTGITTPALICGLSLGPHTYRLVLEGYLDITGNVDLTSGQGEIISQELVPTGSLYITSIPSGASILIDGILQTGKITPTTITDIAEGYRDVTIRLTGFNDYTVNVLVTAGTTTTVPNATLIPSEGCLYFTTNPPGASIYIDDILRAETTPALICGLTIGPHTYRLVLEGYLDITGSIDLISGHGETISQNLIPTGSLYITSNPSGASIYIDGILQIGKTTPDTMTDIPIGYRDITIRTPGFNDYTTTVLIEAGMTTPITDIVLIPNEGCLYFTTNPPGASIYIDDILRAEVTPALICELTLGPHTYRLVLEGYLDITGSVDLTLGHGETISQDLVPIVQAGFDERQRFVNTGLLIGLVSKAIEKWYKMQTEKII